MKRCRISISTYLSHRLTLLRARGRGGQVEGERDCGEQSRGRRRLGTPARRPGPALRGTHAALRPSRHAHPAAAPVAPPPAPATPNHPPVVGLEGALPHGPRAAEVLLLLLPRGVLDPDGGVPPPHPPRVVLKLLALLRAGGRAGRASSDGGLRLCGGGTSRGSPRHTHVSGRAARGASQQPPGMPAAGGRARGCPGQHGAARPMPHKSPSTHERRACRRYSASSSGSVIFTLGALCSASISALLSRRICAAVICGREEQGQRAAAAVSGGSGGAHSGGPQRPPGGTPAVPGWAPPACSSRPSRAGACAPAAAAWCLRCPTWCLAAMHARSSCPVPQTAVAVHLGWPARPKSPDGARHWCVGCMCKSMCDRVGTGRARRPPVLPLLTWPVSKVGGGGLRLLQIRRSYHPIAHRSHRMTQTSQGAQKTTSRW